MREERFHLTSNSFLGTYSMTGIKGADPIFKLSQRSYLVQIWYAQRKLTELGSILSNMFVILNILASRRGWTFWGWNFSRFWRKNEVPSGQRNRERVWSETQKWRKNCYFWCKTLFLESKLIKIYIFTHYNFFHWQNWTKSNRFFACHYDNYNKHSIVKFSLPKVS